MDKLLGTIKNSAKFAAISVLVLTGLTLAVGVPLAGLGMLGYGIYGLITGAGVGWPLIAGAAVTGIYALGPKAPAPPAPSFESSLISPDVKPAFEDKPLKPVFDHEAAITLEQKITVGPALKLKAKAHDLGQP